jgi:hypothetical protein
MSWILFFMGALYVLIALSTLPEVMALKVEYQRALLINETPDNRLTGTLTESRTKRGALGFCLATTQGVICPVRYSPKFSKFSDELIGTPAHGFGTVQFGLVSLYGANGERVFQVEPGLERGPEIFMWVFLALGLPLCAIGILRQRALLGTLK